MLYLGRKSQVFRFYLGGGLRLQRFVSRERGDGRWLKQIKSQSSTGKLQEEERGERQTEETVESADRSVVDLGGGAGGFGEERASGTELSNTVGVVLLAVGGRIGINVGVKLMSLADWLALTTGFVSWGRVEAEAEKEGRVIDEDPKENSLFNSSRLLA